MPALGELVTFELFEFGELEAATGVEVVDGKLEEGEDDNVGCAELGLGVLCS